MSSRPRPIFRALLAASILLLLAGAAPSEHEAAFRAGQALEKAGRLEDAEAEYRKALESKAPGVRAAALASYMRTVQAREREWWEERVSALLDLIAGALPGIVLLVIAGLLYGAVLLCRRAGWLGCGRLEIRDWAATSNAWPGEHFREIVTAMIHRMRPRPGSRFLSIEAPSRPPILIRDLGAGPVTDLIPESAGKWFDWLVRLVRRPEFSVGGSLQVLDSMSHVIVHLERFGRTVEVWEDTCPESDSRDRVKDFVYMALVAVKQGRGRPHAR